MPCDRCVNRRAFLTQVAGAAGAAAIATACGDGQFSGAPTQPRQNPNVPPPTLTITVASFPDLANVGVLVKVGSFHAAKRTGADTFDALSMACTHSGCLIDIIGGQSFDCPCHGSRFDNSGAVINGPFTGERIGPLQKLPTSYDPATDQLTIG
jgi:Rieske Fe-S protein